MSHKEKLIFRGISARGHVTFIHLNTDTQTWTAAIVRPNDPKFGIQRTMRMLVYAGIESKAVANFVAATAQNHKRKQYRLGEVRTAQAKTPGTQTVVYEVVYVEVIDPAEITGKKTKKTFSVSTQKKITVDQSYYDTHKKTGENLDPNGINLQLRTGPIKVDFDPNFTVGTRTGDVNVTARPIRIGIRSGTDVTVTEIIGSSDPVRIRPVPINTVKSDYSGITVDGSLDSFKYISNVSNMRDNIKTVGTTEISYLPLWMRTSQIGSVNILGYTKAIPLCYCKPGKSADVLQALQKAKIKFNQFNFDIDRYVIDQTQGNSNEQYILFHNYMVNV